MPAPREVGTWPLSSAESEVTAPSLARLDALLSELFGRIDYERRAPQPESLRLDSMRELLLRLGAPQRHAPVIHVAGTKGKGSVSAMLGAIFTASGMRCGVYASPHLERLHERFSIDGCPADDDALAWALERALGAARQVDSWAASSGRPPLTFFEITTAVAFLHFARRDAEVVVLETGLGGRLDSTNVCEPEACVITSISLDHTRTLGDTLEKIATEKAGIIKPGRPVISGADDPRPAHVIAQRTRQLGASLIEINRDFDWEANDDDTISVVGMGETFRFRTPDLTVGLLGRHQRQNAAIAVAAIECLKQEGWAIDDAAIATGLANVRLAGRFEVLCRHPWVVVDIAHNPASCAAFCDTFQQQWHGHNARGTGRATAIVSISRDKDAANMAAQLCETFDRIVVTRFESNPRARDVESLVSLFHEAAVAAGRPVALDALPRPLEAWRSVFQDCGPDDAVAVTGSTFLVAELRPVIANRT